MKINKKKLQIIIREELVNLINEDTIDENWLKKAALGTALSLGLGATDPAQAAGQDKQQSGQQDIKILEQYKTKEYSTDLGYDDAYSQAIEEAKVYFGKKYKNFKIKVVKENIKGDDINPTALSLNVIAFQ